MTTDPDLARVPPDWTAKAWHAVCLTRSTDVAWPETRKLYRDRAAAVLVKHGPFTDETPPVVDLSPAMKESIRLNNTGGGLDAD